MSPLDLLAGSNSFSSPLFCVTSRRPSGRKVMAQGSLNLPNSVDAKGCAFAGGVAAASSGGADACAGAGVPLLAVPLQAASRAADRAVSRGATRMGGLRVG
jgi:hypothetical protein